MKLLEYEGKALFAAAGIEVPAARVVQCNAPVADTEGSGVSEAVQAAAAELAGAAAAELSQPDAEGVARADGAARTDGAARPAARVAIKAQLDMGGRGKAGLIKLVAPSDAGLAADEILGKGYPVRALLVEHAADIERELYLSITVDALSARVVILASAEGGVEIEELARSKPDAVRRVLVDPFRGLQPHQARGLAYDLALQQELVRPFADLLTRLFALFRDSDAELVEINPLFVTRAAEGRPARLLAGDAKVIIDDNSLDRHPEFALMRERFDSEIAYEAALEGIPYVQFAGDISLMCAGAGLTTTVFDLVNFEGGSVANYLEFGGPNYRKARRAMELCLKNESRVVLIVTFGTIARADVMAQGVVDAITELQPDRPIVVCIRGTGEEDAERILRGAGLEPLFDTEEAVRRAVALARAERRPAPVYARTEDPAQSAVQSNTQVGTHGERT